jgi:hypothetical protein
MHLYRGQDSGECTSAVADRTIGTDRIIALMIVIATVCFGRDNTTGEARADEREQAEPNEREYRRVSK